MIKTHVLRLATAILLPNSLWAAPNPSDFSITSFVFDSNLTIGGSYQFAGAISSLYWRGQEFVNIGPRIGSPPQVSPDYGRQFQSSISVNGLLECYHPTEAGSAENAGGPTSSSQLLWASTAQNTLQTSTQMAYWLRDGQTSGACPNGATAQGVLSNYTVDKTVRIGFAGIPNVLEYLTTFWVPEHINAGALEAVYAATTDFVNVWRYDLTRKQYNKLWHTSGGEQDAPVVLSNGSVSNPELYLGFYAPEALQPYDGTAVFGWGTTTNPTDPGGAGRLYYRFDGVQSEPGGFGPGHRHYGSYLVVGTREEVQNGLNQLHYHFRNLDPEVFNWKEYHDMYPDVKAACPGHSGAQAHWLAHGINEGRNGSRTFSPSTYLQLYPDLGSPTNYQYAIDHYIMWGRDEGRSTVKKADAGFRHSTVLSTALPASAGLNNFGQLGNGTTTNSSMPVAASGLSSITEIANGDYTTLAVRADGTLWAWGSNQHGLLGNGFAGGSATQPTRIWNIPGIVTPSPNNRRVISLNYTAAAALDEAGHVWTWGVNSGGQLGDGTLTSHYLPAPVKKSPGEYLTDVVSISVGSNHMAALDADGFVWTWGSGYKGALGHGSESNSSYAVRVIDQESGLPLTSIAQVVCGGTNFVIALARDGQIFSWGNNSYGQLGMGNGAPMMSVKAQRITDLVNRSGFTKIAAGAYHVVALSRFFPGSVLAWGYDGNGQLGSNSAATTQRVPIEMEAGPHGMDGITDVAAGSYFSMMIRGHDRRVFVVGDNANGQLAIGTQTQQNLPVLSNF